jgi:hypothetical protein
VLLEATALISRYMQCLPEEGRVLCFAHFEVSLVLLLYQVVVKCMAWLYGHTFSSKLYRWRQEKKPDGPVLYRPFHASVWLFLLKPPIFLMVPGPGHLHTCQLILSVN